MHKRLSARACTGLDIKQKRLQSIDVLEIFNDNLTSSPNVIITLLGKGGVETTRITASSSCLDLGSTNVFLKDR